MQKLFTTLKSRGGLLRDSAVRVALSNNAVTAEFSQPEWPQAGGVERRGRDRLAASADPAGATAFAEGASALAITMSDNTTWDPLNAACARKRAPAEDRERKSGRRRELGVGTLAERGARRVGAEGGAP